MRREYHCRVTVSGDRLVVEALRKASGRSVPDEVWDQVLAEVDRVGVRGLRGSSRTLVDSLVVKHLPGKHDQAEHGNWSSRGAGSAAAGSGAGSFTKDPEEVSAFVPMFGGAYEGQTPASHYVHSTGTRVIITASTPNHEEVLSTYGPVIDDLMRRAPVEGMEVRVGDEYFSGNDMPKSVKGYATYDVGINGDCLGPSENALHVRGPRDEATALGNTMKVPDMTGYTLKHEWGHIRDERSAQESVDDAQVIRKMADEAVGNDFWSEGSDRYNPKEDPLIRAIVTSRLRDAGMSYYGLSDSGGSKAEGGGREAYAEAFAGWVNGVDSPFVRYFADRYGWEKGQKVGLR